MSDQELFCKTVNQCTHVRELPQRPSNEALSDLRRGLRKRKPPKFELGFHGEHTMLGSFAVIELEGDIFLEWSLPGKEQKQASLMDLNRDPDKEFERLELGWLIANMFRLDGVHNCRDIPGPKEMMEMMSWYSKREDSYRHWAKVKAGHMIFTKPKLTG